MGKETRDRKQETRSGRTGSILRTFSFLSCFLFLVPCFSLLPSHAEAIRFEAEVDPPKIAMGTAGKLLLTVSGTQDVPSVEFPQLEGLEARYVGPSTQVKVVNGEYSASKTFVFMLLPLKEGKFTIPSVEITVKGEVYRTQPLVVDVVPSGGQAGAGQAFDPEALADKIRLQIIPSKTAMFVNEEVELATKLFVKDLPLRDISFPDIPQKGFVLSSYEQPRQYSEVVEGRTFNVIEFKTRMTPLKAGALEVGPAVVTANLIFEVKGRRDPFGGSAFGDDLFAGFFGNYEKKPLTITAPALRIEVVDLPTDNVPEGFSGAVGRFTFDASLTPQDVSVGDPVTLHMTVMGTGDIKSVRLPELKVDGFKLYEPQVKEEDGKKTWEQVVIPLKEGLQEFPAVRFSYFDTETRQYVVLSRGGFPIKVTAAKPGEEFKAVGFEGGAPVHTEESFGKDIIFIKDRPGQLRKAGSGARQDWPLYLIGGIYLNIWGAVLVWILYRRRIMGDPALAKRAGILRETRGILKKASGILAADRSREFYDLVTEALRTYLAVKMDIPAGELGAEELIRAVSRQDPDPGVAERLRRVLAMAEQVRFAGSLATEDRMRADLVDAEKILEHVERRVK